MESKLQPEDITANTKLECADSQLLNTRFGAGSPWQSMTSRKSMWRKKHKRHITPPLGGNEVVESPRATNSAGKSTSRLRKRLLRLRSCRPRLRDHRRLRKLRGRLGTHRRLRGCCWRLRNCRRLGRRAENQRRPASSRGELHGNVLVQLGCLAAIHRDHVPL